MRLGQSHFIKLLIIIFYFFVKFSHAKEEVLFTINNKPFTTIDFDQRVTYLNLISDIDQNKINEQDYLNDFISIKIFNEFAKNGKIKINENEVNNIFKIFIDKLDNKNLILTNIFIKNKEITKTIILDNIIYDLQRKKVINRLLNERISKINIPINNLDLINIFDIRFNYYIISNINKNQLLQLQNILLNQNIETIHQLLENKNIEYEFFTEDLIKLNHLDKEIQEKIINGENIFLIDRDNYLILGVIQKKLKKNIGLKYSFFHIKPKNIDNFNSIDQDSIKCQNIEKKISSSELEAKKYSSIELEKLNINIFSNLSKVNDKLLIKNNNQEFLILLCNIDYNKELADNRLYKNKIEKLSEEITLEFIKKHKKIYNFNLFQ